MSLSLTERQAIVNRIAAWQAGRTPNGQYPVQVARAILLDDHLQPGDNYYTQFWAQFTGREETVDKVDWDYPEIRPDYSQTSRWNLGYKFDCSSVCYIDHKTWFNKSIGSYTEAQYTTLPKLGAYKIDFKYRRIGDLHQYLFPSSSHPNVSHDSRQITDPVNGKGGLICHTTSASNPFRFETDQYSLKYLVCTWRLPWFPYQDMFVQDSINFHYGMWDKQIFNIEYNIKKHLGEEVGGTPDGYFGDQLVHDVIGFQWLKHLPITGAVDSKTLKALEATPHQEILWEGRYNNDVGLMKLRMQKHGFGLDLDQKNLYFDAHTKADLQNFQTAKGIPADGTCGKESTWPALLKAPVA